MDKQILLKSDKNGIEFFYISFDYDANLVEFVKKIPTRKFHAQTSTWKIRADHVTAKYVEAFARKLDFQIDPSAKNYIEKMVRPVFEVEMPKLKRELRDFQKEGVAYAVKYERCFIADEMGLGKAQSLDSKILTPTGWKLMRNIKLGDKIINSGGTESEVMGIYPQGIKDAYKIVFNDGAETITSDCHLWNIQSANHRFRNNKFLTKQLKEFKDDLFLYKKGRKNSKWFIPMVSPINFNKNDVSIDAYLLGVILGDGCITKSVRITSADAEIIDLLKSVLDTDLQIRNTRKYEYTIIKANTHKWCKNILISNLRDLNLYGHNAYNKFIPDAYKFNSIDIRISILQGLMDIDGYISSTGDTIQFYTSSKQLGQDVKFIVNSLGGTAKISSRMPMYVHKGIKKIGKKAYTLDISLPDSVIPFRLNRKICKLHKVKKYIPHRAFKSVEYIGKLPMQCIKTSSPDGLYVTDDCIVTHNSGESIAAVETTHSYPCLIVCPASLKLNWKKEIKLWLDKSVKVIDGLIKINYDTIHGKRVVSGYEEPDYDADFVIINYDILYREKKITNAFKPDDIEIPDHKDLLKKIPFKSIIVDESHMCFPYNTMIQTKLGKLKIGDIVENKIDVPVLSYNLQDNKHEYKKIGHFYTNDISKRTFLKIYHTYGYIILTDNHKVYIEGKGYVKASEIKKNDRMRILPPHIRKQKEREKTTKVLFKEMCNKLAKNMERKLSRNNKKIVRSEKAIGKKNMFILQKGVSSIIKGKTICQQDLLLNELFNKIKMDLSRICRKKKKSSEYVMGKNVVPCEGNEKITSGVGIGSISSNEIEQSNEECRNERKGIQKITKKDIFISWWKRNWTYCTTIEIGDKIGSSIGKFRIYYTNWRRKITFQIGSKFLSGRHCISRNKSGNRGRWKFTQNKKMEIFRPKENKDSEFSWVENIEILEPRDYERHGISNGTDKVYNLEINKNNNYFADNILVSNCSNHKSLRTKAVKEISRKIRYRYALSGTPILNRPKELIAQLDILDRLESLGGFWGFAKRYCVPEDAPILMSDFKNKKISDIIIGDEIIGWKRVGKQQRIVKSKVLNILKRRSELQKLVLENGNEIICTPDHKWLNGRYETQYEYMESKIGRKLIEICPTDVKSIIDFNSESYMKGYILGAFRGDGHCTMKTTIRFNYFKDLTTTGVNNHSVGISTLDIEIIDRIEKYLNMLNIKEYHRSIRTDGLYSLNVTNKTFYDFILNLKLLDTNSKAGFLAGIYDTDGSGKVICQSKLVNGNTYNIIKECLSNFNIKYTEKKDGEGFFLPMSRKQFIRFWNLINPALQRKFDAYIFNFGGKFKTDRIKVKEIIPIIGIHNVYTLTTETGNYVVYGMGSKNCNAFEGDFGWDFSGSSNLDELYSKLKQTCFIRRKKEDVLSELPPKQRIMLPVELSNAKEYENASKNFRKWMKMNMMNESEYYEELKNVAMLTDSQRRVIANAKATNKLNQTLAAEALVKIEKLKQIVARGKLQRVYEFIDNFLLYDEKLLIFAKHQEIYNKIIDKYKDISVHIIGGMTSKQKDKAVEEFQNNPNIKLFIGALDAAGVGLNLTQSSTVAFVELGWTSAIHDQAEDRVHRIGQKDFVKCYYFYTEKTIDEQILELIETKRNLTANISDGISIPQDSATDDDITQILSKLI